MERSSDSYATPENGQAAPSAITRDTRDTAWKTTLVDLLPPATVVAVILLWMFLPRELTESPWAIVIAAFATSFYLLGLEFVFERFESWRINGREFATDLFYMVLMYTAIGWAVEALADGPLIALKEQLGLATPWIAELPFVIQVALVIFLIEFGQYWMHRWMHNWYPLWLTHAPHHHITQLNAMKGFVGNPIELFLISLSVVALLDFDIVPLLCAINVLGVVSGFAHANVRSNPPLFYSYFLTTIRHHSLHHTALSYEDTRCNYGNSLILIDRLFGTYRDGESEIVGQDDRRRLSIYEQFMFPFQPLIDKFGAGKDEKSSTR